MSNADVSLAVALLQPEKWTALLNDSLTVYVTDTEGSAQSFKPTFTYPIFGDAESIFGYQDLAILLCFDSVTFYPFLNVRYLRKLDDVEVDPAEKMLEFLPELTIFKDETKWRDAIEREQKDFQIPGEQMGVTFEKDGRQYAIYKINTSSPSGTELHKRLQVLVLLFIEAGTFIEVDDPLWDLYVLYDVTKSSLPEVIGFSTAYNYWKYPGHEAFDAGSVQIRKKLSQFVILPSHQGKSLGGEFYLQLYQTWLADENIIEVVVEDPNESFDDLRDRVDLTWLVLLKALDLETLTTQYVSDSSWFDKFKKEHKLEKRQLQRLLEMALLSLLKLGQGKNSRKDVRLFVKRRLFEKNHEALEPLDDATRKDKIHTAYELLETDYYRILEPVKMHFKRLRTADASGSHAKKAKSGK